MADVGSITLQQSEIRRFVRIQRNDLDVDLVFLFVCQVVAELIGAGVPLDRGDTAGRTSLHWASVLGRTAVVRMLLHAGE